jgi:hypothetical protein
VLLPTFQANNGPLLFYKRFIDNAFLIWTPKTPFAPIESFLDLLPFGKLTWTSDPPSHSVNFLDLTLTISNGQIISKTYVKPHNLHLYLPPTSAHAPGVLKSLIFGNLQRYWKQNTHTSDFSKIASDFYQHLLARGHNPATVSKIFLDAALHLDNSTQRPSTNRPSKSNPKLFLHWEFHPKCIPLHQIRSIFNETCQEVLSTAHSASGKKPTIGRLTVAFSKPKNIGNLLCRSKLTEPPGQRASDTMKTLQPANPSL